MGWYVVHDVRILVLVDDRKCELPKRLSPRGEPKYRSKRAKSHLISICRRFCNDAYAEAAQVDLRAIAEAAFGPNPRQRIAVWETKPARFRVFRVPVACKDGEAALLQLHGGQNFSIAQ